MNFSPPLPRHYSISPAVQAEIDALCADLGLKLVAKSHLPYVLSQYQYVRMFDEGFGIAVKFVSAVDVNLFPKSVREELVGFNPLDEKIRASRALCASLCERNHKRKYVYESCNDSTLLPFDW